MKTYKDIYEFPLHKTKYGSHVNDKIGQFVFQFEPKFDKEGEFQEGWENYEQELLAVINKEKTFKEDNLTYRHEEGHIFVSSLEEPIITIRGWGNLTGIGGHNLPSEEAVNIQDTFAEYIVERLNCRILSNDEYLLKSIEDAEKELE